MRNVPAYFMDALYTLCLHSFNIVESNSPGKGVQIHIPIIVGMYNDTHLKINAYFISYTIVCCLFVRNAPYVKHGKVHANVPHIHEHTYSQHIGYTINTNHVHVVHIIHLHYAFPFPLKS